MTEETEGVRKDSATREKDQKENIDWRNKNFYQSVYGVLYEDSAGTDITLTTANDFYQWVSSTEGLSSGVAFVVPSTANDNIAIGASGEGVYLVCISSSFAGSNNSNIHGVVFKNGVRQGNIEFHRKLGGTDVGDGAAFGLIALSSGDTIDIRFSSDTSSTTLTVQHVQLVIVRIGP